MRFAPTLGDIASDVGAATPSGIGPWLTNQVADFHRLPSQLQTMQAQVRGAQAVLQQSSIPNAPAAQALQTASEMLGDINTNYPGVNTQLGVLTSALLPVLPKIYAGNIDAEVLAALLRSGGDIVSTVYSVNSLLAKRDQAQQLIQQALSDPTVPQSVRDQMANAIAGADTSLILKVGLGLFALYLIYDIATKK